MTKKNARKTATRVLAQSTPNGLDGPYRLSSTMPATIVGRANGMSITTSRTCLPRNRSRTSTQAIVVPITMFTSVTRNAWVTVKRSAAAVCSLVSA